MKKKKTTPKKAIKPSITEHGPSIVEVAYHVHHTVARHCQIYNKPMSPSEVNDWGSLCETCYHNEYGH